VIPETKTSVMIKGVLTALFLGALFCMLSCQTVSPDRSQPVAHSSVPLISNICGSGNWAAWDMKNTSSGSITRLECSIQGEGATWGCYTSSGSGVGAIAELDYYKTDSNTYWNPGLPQNLKWFLYDDPTFGWKPIIAYILNFDGAYTTTIYYYSVPPESAGEPLFQDATNARVGWLSINQFDNSCQTYPGEIPPTPIWKPEYVAGGYQYTNGPWRWLTGRWTTIVNLNDSLPCDGILDYCGSAISLTQHEGSYDYYAVGTKEKWWFSNDPSGRQPRMLKKVQQTEFDGSADDMTIETNSTIFEKLYSQERIAVTFFKSYF
jgi:hypothetical protein